LIQALVIVACIFGILAFCLSAWAIIEVKAMQKSTHTFQPIHVADDGKIEIDEDGFEVLNKKTRQKLEDESDLFDDETNFGEMQ
jgi:hypothetical protein